MTGRQPHVMTEPQQHSEQADETPGVERERPVFPPRTLRFYGGTLWPSFLTAAVASMVFFAAIDPATLHLQTLPGWEIGRMTGYTIGFFMFWAVGLGSSLLTYFLTSEGNAETR